MNGVRVGLRGSAGIVVVVMASVAAVLGAVAPPAAAQVSDGLIAFDTSVGIHVVAADGSDRRTLVAESGARHPRWSPDGSKIVYHDNAHSLDPSHIYVMNADGSDRQRLVAGDLAEWTPDGRALIFRIDNTDVDGSAPDDPDLPRVQLARFDLASGEVERLPVGWSGTLDTSLSPDGTRVAFMTHSSLKVWRLDSSEPSTIRYPIPSFWETDVTWVDEERVIYSCRGPSDVADLCVLDLRTHEATRLTTSDNWEHTAVFSPTGERVLVAAMNGLYVMDPDGGNVVWLHDNPGMGGSNNPGNPSWQGLGRDLTVPCDTLSFTDVCADATHAAGVDALVAAGITDGYLDGTFRPSQPVTRAQMASFLTRALDL